MTKRASVGLILAVAAAGGVALMVHNRSGPSFDLTPYNALGVGAAEETAKLVGNSGKVKIIAPQLATNSPSMQSELGSFQKTLKSKGITIASTVTFRAATPLEQIESGGMLSRAQLLDALQGSSSGNVSAVVLFCGVPRLTAQDREAVKQSGTKVIVVSAFQPDLYSLLKAQVIELAVVPKPGSGPDPAKKPNTLRESFESSFAVLTPENVETFAAQSVN